VRAELKEEGESTSCTLTTDLTISGKAAQFGRGVLSDVATKLIGQFADRLEADLLAGSSVEIPSEAPHTPVSHGKNDASVDLLSVVALPIAKRVLPVLGGLSVGTVIGYLLGGRR
jgi:hypothetical protein